VLEAALPVKSGYEVLMEIRRISNVPVVMLASKGGDADEIHGFEMGADVYLRKPVSYLVLLARIKALLRRANMPPIARAGRELQLGELSIDMQRQQVAVRGQQIRLTPVEYRLLYHLARNRGTVVSHQTLLDQALGLDKKASRPHLKVFISRLRAKIEQQNGPRYIETVRRVGYRFVLEEE